MDRSSRSAANHLRSHRLRGFRQRRDNTVSLRDGLSAIANQLQNFIEDETLGFEQVAVVGSARCSMSVSCLPVSYLLVQFGEGEQRGQRFLASNRCKDAVALLKRRIGVAVHRHIAFGNSCWACTHDGDEDRKNPASIVLWLTNGLIAALGSTAAIRPSLLALQYSILGAAHVRVTAANFNFERNSLSTGTAMSVSTRPTAASHALFYRDALPSHKLRPFRFALHSNSSYG
jgi:hypothetical protein